MCIFTLLIFSSRRGSVISSLNTDLDPKGPLNTNSIRIRQKPDQKFEYFLLILFMSISAKFSMGFVKSEKYKFYFPNEIMC